MFHSHVRHPASAMSFTDYFLYLIPVEVQGSDIYTVSLDWQDG